jgi:hypothetical protein
MNSPPADAWPFAIGRDPERGFLEIVTPAARLGYPAMTFRDRADIRAEHPWRPVLRLVRSVGGGHAVVVLASTPAMIDSSRVMVDRERGPVHLIYGVIIDGVRRVEDQDSCLDQLSRQALPVARRLAETAFTALLSGRGDFRPITAAPVSIAGLPLRLLPQPPTRAASAPAGPRVPATPPTTPPTIRPAGPAPGRLSGWGPPRRKPPWRLLTDLWTGRSWYLVIFWLAAVAAAGLVLAILMIRS